MPILFPKKYQNKSLEISAIAYQEISQRPYSKTIDYMLQSGYFKEKYLENYYHIIYQTFPNFGKYINVLLEKNYTPQEINSILATFGQKNISVLLEKDHIDITPYLEFSNIELDKLDRYQAYMVEKSVPLRHAITEVNIGLDQPFYTNYSVIDDPDSITVLVNKYHALPASYVPKDLVTLSYQPYLKLRKEAAIHFEEMIEAARISGHYIYPFSPYRSYERQKELYDTYEQKEGKEKADTYSARPGFSEHQTGLTVDVRSAGKEDNLTASDYEWILKYGPTFGFIVRYPEGKSHITGYKNEPWHLRYVGEDIAKEIQEKNITFDEYYDLYLKK